MVDSYLNIGRHSWQSCGGGNNFHHHFIRHSAIGLAALSLLASCMILLIPVSFVSVRKNTTTVQSLQVLQDHRVRCQGGSAPPALSLEARSNYRL